MYLDSSTVVFFYDATKDFKTFAESYIEDLIGLIFCAVRSSRLFCCCISHCAFVPILRTIPSRGCPPTGVMSLGLRFFSVTVRLPYLPHSTLLRTPASFPLGRLSYVPSLFLSTFHHHRPYLLCPSPLPSFISRYALFLFLSTRRQFFSPHFQIRQDIWTAVSCCSLSSNVHCSNPKLLYIYSNLRQSRHT